MIVTIYVFYGLMTFLQITDFRNRFAKVFFGVKSSLFLLNAVINKHVEKYEFDDEFVQEVLESFYVHDFSGGANAIEGTFELFKKLKIRFLEGSFNLRKWRANESNLREQYKWLQLNSNPEPLPS